MKKHIRKKTNNNNTTSVAQASALNTVRETKQKHSCLGTWSLSIYVYWFIILFFIAATFYILGRSHNMLNYSPQDKIAEEALLQSNDYYENGKTKLLSGDMEGAIADLGASITANPDALEPYILRGEAYMQSGSYDNAMADFNAVIEKDASNAVVYFDRSLLNSRMENYQAALNDINMALQLTATQPNEILAQRDLYAKRGQLNLWLKNWEGAIADYTNSLARPDGIISPSVYAERAEAYTAVGNYAGAIEDYASAVRVIAEQIQGATTDTERESLSGRAMTYFERSAALNLNLGDVDKARSDLAASRAIAVALNDSVTTERLDSLLVALDPAQQAPVVEEPVAEPQPEPVAEPQLEPVAEPQPEPVEEIAEPVNM